MIHVDKHFRLEKPKPFWISKLEYLLNRWILHRYGYAANIGGWMNYIDVMITPWQKINFYHLVSDVLFNRVKGDFIELGCFEGQTATLFAYMLEKSGSDKKLLLYDDFRLNPNLEGAIRDRLFANFREWNLKPPMLVEGKFEETVPSSLPSEIAFMHIDCGYGGPPLQHKEVILHCLDHCYPRMSPGAVCILSDYHVDGITVKGGDSNKGVRMACDEFFSDKPEKVLILYGGEYSHGYFRKALP